VSSGRHVLRTVLAAVHLANRRDRAPLHLVTPTSRRCSASWASTKSADERVDSAPLNAPP
jgi:hypothetical protein